MALHTWFTHAVLSSALILMFCPGGNGELKLDQHMQNYTLMENQAIGPPFYQLKASGGVPPYRFAVGSSDIFSVQEFTGWVSLVRLVNHEFEKTIRAEFTVQDGQDALSTRVTFIPVGDVNDNFPEFKDKTMATSFKEDEDIGYVVYPSLVVTDNDTSANDFLTVQCDRGGNDSKNADACDTFDVIMTSNSNKDWVGYISLKKKVNFEEKSYYQIALKAFDGELETKRSVEVNLINVQDSPPFFIRAEPITVEEGVEANVYLDYVLAEDGDSVDKRQIRYELRFVQNLVELDSVSGNITTKVAFDRESSDFSDGYIDIGVTAREVISPGQLGNDPTTTAYTTIRINVLDINDNSPKFEKTVFVVNITEDIPNKAPLPKVNLVISDPDQGTNSQFNIFLTNYTNEFEVSPAAGLGSATALVRVKNTTLIDYEKGPRQYVFDVVAREGSTPEQRSGLAQITVNILEVNDNQPVFSQQSYSKNISEQSIPGFFVLQVFATDIDSGIFGTAGIRFELVGDGSHLFTIDSISGVIRVANCSTPGKTPCIDYETKKQYDLNVYARDNNGQGDPKTADLVIKILDVNDNPPQFARNYISYIEELKTVPNPEVNVTALDPDTVGGTIIYTLFDNSNKWQIDKDTGVVTAKQPILYDDAPGQNGTFRMVVNAFDGLHIGTVNVTIYVIDKNNNPPVFDQLNYYKRIDEKTPGDSFVLEVRATDKDSPTSQAGQIEYEIEPGFQAKFVINSATGNISTASEATFDFDETPQYVMKVRGLDRGTPQLTGTCTVTIDIIDANNKDPFFEPSTIRGEVYENVQIGYTVLKLEAEDPDEFSMLRYNFVEPKTAVGPDGVEIDRNLYDFTNLFTVNASSGVVTTNRLLDRDEAAIVTLTVNVVDINANPYQTGIGNLIINILEYNDQAPYFLPYVNVTIEEERPIGAFVMTLLAKDDDDTIAQYLLVNNPNQFFAIGFNTGVVSVNKRIDFEKVESTTFTALVYDSGIPRLNATAKVYVTIKNINDNKPIFSQLSYSKTIAEHSNPGTYVLTVTATDADKGDYGVVRYQIFDSRFVINETTGDINVAPGAVLDRETESRIDVLVRAYDSPLDATVRTSTDVRVYIALSDINDNVPVFQPDFYYKSIIETVPTGISVIQVTARDADIGINAEIVFSISNSSGDPDGLFGITEKSGIITVVKSLLKNSGNYYLTVKAQDGDGNGPDNHTDTAFVHINVTEATNSPPYWVIPPTQNMTVTVLENQYLGMIVYNVHAEDSDRGDNGIIDYYFYVGGQYVNHTDEFFINTITGVISARQVYDREYQDRYTLLLMARDRGNPTKLESSRYITIRIIDVNDNIPKFPTLPDGSTRPYEFVVGEDAQIGDYVGQPLEAIDIDENPKIYYYIIGGDGIGVFALNKDTGQITVAGAIDSEVKNQYYLDVRATNNISDYSVITSRRKRALTPDIVRVDISVRNTNDAPPVFEKDSYTGCISTRAPIGQSIVTVYAQDQDSFGGVKYSITSGNINNGLQIGESTGIITNAVLMADFVSGGNTQFNLVVEASDNSLTDTANVKVFVTQEGNEVELVITQPPIEVRQFVEQIKTIFETFTDSNGNKLFEFVCISAVKDHLTSAEQQTSYFSDVYVSAISTNSYIYTGEELLSLLNGQRSQNPDSFDLLYIQSIDVADDEPTYLDDTPAMVVMIIVAILFFLVILFIILAIYCIRRSKQKSKRDLEQKRIVANSAEPSMYDNRGFIPEEPQIGYISDEPEEVQYAKVQKTFIDTRPREPEPPIEITGPESIDAVIRDNDDGSSSEDSQSDNASPITPRRPIEEEVEDFRIETEVVES